MTSAEPTLARLGCRPGRGRGRYTPCPACKADRDSEGRAPLRPAGASIYCNACGFRGSVVALVREALDLGWQEAYRWLDGVGADAAEVPWTPQERREPVRPPTDLLLAELQRARRLQDVDSPDLRAFLTRRAIPRSAPAGWLPDCRLMPRGYPLVVPMFGPAGQLLSLQGRALDGRTPKTRHPKGYDATGLLFADPLHARPFLRGGPAPRRLWVFEGLTDFLGWTPRLPDDAVLGIVSGSARCFEVFAHRLQSTSVRLVMDVGGAGGAYTRRVADVLYPHPDVLAIDLRRVAPMVA